MKHEAAPDTVGRMLHYFKFRRELFAPVRGREVYLKRRPGRGWPEQCPPVGAANAFGFDLLANFDVTFVQTRAKWRVLKDIVINAACDCSCRPDAVGQPRVLQYACRWQT